MKTRKTTRKTKRKTRGGASVEDSSSEDLKSAYYSLKRAISLEKMADLIPEADRSKFISGVLSLKTKINERIDSMKQQLHEELQERLYNSNKKQALETIAEPVSVNRKHVDNRDEVDRERRRQLKTEETLFTQYERHLKQGIIKSDAAAAKRSLNTDKLRSEDLSAKGFNLHGITSLSEEEKLILSFQRLSTGTKQNLDIAIKSIETLIKACEEAIDTHKFHKNTNKLVKSTNSPYFLAVGEIRESNNMARDRREYELRELYKLLVRLQDDKEYLEEKKKKLIMVSTLHPG